MLYVRHSIPNVFVHETLLIWFEILALQLISLCFCSMAGHGSCKFEFLPWIKFEVISFLTVKKEMKSVLVLGCVSLNSWCSRCSISWCESKLIYHAKMAFILLLDSVNGQEMVLFSCTWKTVERELHSPMVKATWVNLIPKKLSFIISIFSHF